MTKRFISALTLLAMLLVGTLVFAQQSGGKSGGKSGGHKSGGGKNSSAKVEAQLEDLSKQLDLTEDQKTKIKPILQDESKKVKELKKDTSLSDSDRKAKRKEIREDALKQIRPTLTPEQQKKLDQMPKHEGKGGKNTEPKAQQQ